MEITSTTTLHLGKELVQKIISEYCEAEGFKVRPKDVRFNVNRHLEGYGLGEYEVLEFEGCTVSCKGE